MQINEALNLVIPISRAADGSVLAYGYHIPISREVFDANYRILSATKAALFAKGANYAADVGPRVAALRLMDEARADAADRNDLDGDGAPNIAGAKAFLAELARLTTVLIPSEKGWETVPVNIAIQRGKVDQEEWSEAESSLVFFTCVYSLATKARRKVVATATASVIGGIVTSSALMEFLASLQTSTQAEATPAKAASSVPY